MDSFPRVDLRIVLADSVRPHEIADPARESRIERRLRADGLLRDPLVVGAVPDVDGYVLLDGTNRKRALAALGLPYLLVQIVDYSDEQDVRLLAWCHGSDISLADLLQGAATIPELAINPVAPLGASDALREPGTIALVMNRNEQHALVRRPGAASGALQLRRLVDLYEHRMTRMDCGPDNIEERAQSLAAGQTLLAFPGFSRSQVVTMALRGALIPAGITRHIIGVGRALRVNLPLEMLAGTRDQEAANVALRAHLDGLQPRHYREPTILFDS